MHTHEALSKITTTIQSGRLRFNRRGASTPLWGVESCSLPSRRPNPIPPRPPYVVRAPHLHGAPTTEEASIVLHDFHFCFRIVSFCRRKSTTHLGQMSFSDEKRQLVLNTKQKHTFYIRKSTNNNFAKVSLSSNNFSFGMINHATTTCQNTGDQHRDSASVW